jgi:tellurite resistance protein
MENQPARIANFPITLFPSVMGLAGLALAWKKAAYVLSLSFDPHLIFAAIAAIVFTLLCVLYTLKIARFRREVSAEFFHPVKANFFPTVSISLVLLAALALEFSRPLAGFLFALGALTQLSLTLLIFSRWIFADNHQNQHLTPAWFIPVVGNVLMPVVAVPLGLDELGWFFFSIGIVFWIVLFTILMHRLFFLDPMPLQLTPTLFILIAPPAVAFISYLNLNGYVDNFAQVLYGVALFLTLLLLVQAPRFRKLPFFLSWWAYSFPLAAISIASLEYFQQTQYRPVFWIAISLLALTTVVVTGLFFRTLIAMRNNQICVPE